MISRSTRKLILLILFALTASVTFIACSRSNGQSNASVSPSPVATVEVSTTAAISRQLPRFFEGTGSLAADVQTDVQPQTAGKIVTVGVDMGSAVRRGQMLVRLEAADYQLRVEQAVAQLENAKAAVKQAEERIGLRSGQSFVPERVADVAAARANYDLAESNFQRAQKLVESGDISRAEYDQRKAQRDQLRQVYESAITIARQN